ncbi:hypothetical protein EVG20_g6660 [Dentipellis fragilis]|uniref:Uncharacterized protein n=1 Tax=Dentipellis fragilis TaxID=205917 RepID=A0A4Y9YM62_9AGAM|nr:hypothetical protein EVG20_g6660 [Dentipellis fragilis]
MPTFTTDSYLVGRTFSVCDPEPEMPAQIHPAIVNDLWLTVDDASNAISKIIASVMLIYRCFITWERSLRVGLSLITLLLATITCIVANLCYESQTYMIGRITNASSSPPLAWVRLAHLSAAFRTASDVMVLFTTMVAALLIVGRIWWASRDFDEDLGKTVASAYQSAIRIIVESGAIYLSGLVAVLIVHQTAFAYATTFDYILNPLLGIARTLIDLRVGTCNVETTLAFTQTAPMQISKTINLDSMPSDDSADQLADAEGQN